MMKTNWTVCVDKQGCNCYNKLLTHPFLDSNKIKTYIEVVRRGIGTGLDTINYIWKGTICGYIFYLDIENMPEFSNNSLTDKELIDIENNAIERIKYEIEKDVDEINTLERRVQLLKMMLD